MEVWQFLPGELKLVWYLVSGLAISLPLLKVPPAVLCSIGRMPFLSPNWLSIWRAPIAWIGTYVYFCWSPYMGFNMLVFAFMLDRLDGKVAEALENQNDIIIPRLEGTFRGDLNYPGSTPTGKWLDPLVDKLTVPVPLAIFGYLGHIDQRLFAGMILFEALGTVLRKPFSAWWPFTYLAPIVRSDGASWAGKTKIVGQYTTLIMCIPGHQGWLEQSPIMVNVTLAITTVLGMVSVLSRLRTTKKMDEAMDAGTRVFGHKE